MIVKEKSVLQADVCFVWINCCVLLLQSVLFVVHE